MTPFSSSFRKMDLRTVAGRKRKARYRPRPRRPHAAGFTLIELLVVFSILALLLTLATPRYFKAVDGGKEKVQAQNLATLRDAIDKFRADQGKYPMQLQEVVDKRYLREIPLDPVSGSRAWEVLPFPTGAEPGIYDVRAPLVPNPIPPKEGVEPPTTEIAP